MRPTIIFCDLDGTIFDPDLRALKAPFYNRRSSKLMDRPDTAFVVTTGRHSWGPWTRLNYVLTGMRRPDFIIWGAGTFIDRLENGKYVKDSGWDAQMRNAFDKQALQQKLSGKLGELKLTEYTVPNPYMIVVPFYGMTLEKASHNMREIAHHLFGDHIKVILTEQLFLPNNEHAFNGYALIVPDVAGKDTSSRYIIDHYEKAHKQKLNMLTFGDASVDIPLLTMTPPHNVAEHKSYGLHLTPLARGTLRVFQEEKKVHTVPTLREGSAPESIYNVLSAYYKSPRNSPYRAFLAPFEALIDKTVHPKLTPNELTWKGLEDVREGLKKGGLRGFLRVARGHLIDAADGIRARRHPHLKTDDGQLIDVYADRVKEFEALSARGQYETALTCILPSIARAQAEALGKTVPELDQAGGSALTRTRRLLTSLLFNTLGFKSKSQQIDNQIEQSNIATFNHRKRATNGFSWTISSLKTYDRASLERLLLLVELIQIQFANVSAEVDPDKTLYKEYLAVKVPHLRKELKIPKPALTEAV